MSSFEEFSADDDIRGMGIWTASVHATEEREGIPTLYVVTKTEFHFFRFNDSEDQLDAAHSFSHGGDAEHLTPQHEITIPLDGILRAERVPGKDWFYIRSENDEKTRWHCIYCPSDLARILFQRLRSRLRSRMRVTDGRQSVLSALGSPLGCLLVLWFFVMLVWVGAKQAEQPNAGQDNQFRPVTRGQKAVEGAKMLGKQLGPTMTLGIGGLITLGCMGWCVIAVAQRPKKKILVPRRSSERIEEDEDEEEEVQQPSSRKQLSKKPSRRQGKKSRRSVGKSARILGVAAIVVGALALALGWIASLQVAMLIFTVAGVGVAIGGIVATRADYGEGQVMPVTGLAINILALVVIVGVMFVTPDKSTDEKGGAALLAAASGDESTPNQNVQPNPANNKPKPADKPNPPNNKPDTPASVMSDWGEPLDPDGDCKIALQNGCLVIDVPASPHGLTEGVGKGNAPRVLREVEGDFSIQVKVCGTLHPQPKKNAQALPFQAGGLLLWDESQTGHYVRFVRSGQDRKGTFQSVIAFTQRESDKTPAGGTTPVPEQDVFLKMERRGNLILGSYSLDGQNWTSLPASSGVYPSRVKVGAIALNSTQQAMTVRFEGLRFEQ